MELQGRACFALTQASFLNVVIIGGGCPQALPVPLPRSALGLAFQLIFSRTRIPRLWCGGLMVSSGIHSLVCAMRTTISPSFDYLVVFYYYYIYFFIAALRLHGCAGFSLVVASGGYSSLQCVGF